MKIDYGFMVGAPLDQAWSRMLDLEKIAPCLPGAAIREELGDGEYACTMKVEETNETDHRAVLRATGREARGQGTASATIVSVLREEGSSAAKTLTSPSAGPSRELLSPAPVHRRPPQAPRPLPHNNRRLRRRQGARPRGNRSPPTRIP